MSEPILYQFELCPFCHKVKAGLDLKGVSYKKVDVNPMTKKELPVLPLEAPQKVPVLEMNGDTVADSTDILLYLDEKFPSRHPFLPQDSEARKKNEEIEQWVDDELTYSLPTVIYGTWPEAIKAAQVTARTSNFGFLQNLTVRAGGSLIMHAVSRRILKKRGRSDGHSWVGEEVDRFEQWLGETPFVTGDALALGDVAVHGAISCVRDFPIFAEIMERPRVAAWYERVERLRQESRP